MSRRFSVLLRRGRIIFWNTPENFSKQGWAGTWIFIQFILENLRRLFIRFAPFCSFRQQKAKTPQNRDSEAKKAKRMVHPTRFELMTFYSGGRRSIQLSYGCPCHCYIKYSLFLIFKAGVDKNPVFFNDFPGDHGNSGIFPPPHLPKLVIFSVPFPKCPCEI